MVKMSGSTASGPANWRTATIVPSGMPIQSAAKQADATAASMSRVGRPPATASPAIATTMALSTITSGGSSTTNAAQAASAPAAVAAFGIGTSSAADSV